MLKAPGISAAPALALSAALLLPVAARAEREPSPQRFAFEIKFGPYVPKLDSTSGVNGTPFSDRFGDQSSPKGEPPPRGLLSQGEFDFQFLHKFGTLGIGLSGGYYGISAPAFTRVGAGAGTACTVDGAAGGARQYNRVGYDTTKLPALKYENCTSGDTDTFNLVPLSLMLVYRFDVLDVKWRIPLIPYIKVGLAYYIWWFGNSSSFVSNFVPPGGTESTPAAGASLGFVVHPGISLDLSAIDSKAARAIDQEIGLNRVAAFVEMNGAFVDGFGATNKLNLSDLSLNAGLSFEF